MASQIVEQSRQTVMGAKDQKLAQLQENTRVADAKSRITSDYGVKQNNTDEWLRINRDDQIGPMLLEDPFAREKACHPRTTFPAP